MSGQGEYVIDGTAIRSKRAMFTTLASALSFPDWFGHNLDALYDCLTDLSWLPEGDIKLVWTDSEVLAGADPTGYAGIREVLDDAVEGFATPGRSLAVEIS
ncbi:barstar family protein [Actinokineospora diospyrosa]|uniref:Barstar, RNAse (Barnase) inhibitor n=1 Tax=Actinokineospora diospyrosa TaxID=103728 RepID=A0ABT1IB42_9PSEU|nr:barstar family protein [Actinokineospora diospyrosa]MCP2269766.1 Barstar, RNAse (barnase) inhibitor [Actinokineospora diospyrosa]